MSKMKARPLFCYLPKKNEYLLPFVPTRCIIMEAKDWPFSRLLLVLLKFHLKCTKYKPETVHKLLFLELLSKFEPSAGSQKLHDVHT